MNESWRMTAVEIAAHVRAGQISAREVADAALARLEAVNPAINAVVDYRPEAVRAAADAVDRAIARGDDPGILAGVPITVKVNIDQAGYANTNGVTLQRDLIARSNSPVIDNLERAGAVILGRTNTPAFSLRWFTSNLLHGTTRNPHDPALTPGGSSGGAAAAVASGIGALAHGTDLAGSIRYPAYACGVHGLRPTLGRIPAYNASGPERLIGAQLTAVSGPLGRSIADLRLGLEAMAAADPHPEGPRDPWWVPAPLEGPPAPRRAALCLRPGGMRTAPEVEAALTEAARRLEIAGWAVEIIDDVPSLRETAETQVQLWIGEGFDVLAELAAREGDPGALAVIEGLRPIVADWPADIALRALARRATLSRAWRQCLARRTLLLLPVSAELPFPDGLDTRGAESFERVWQAQLTQIALPLTGLPGLTVATGFAGAAPVGVQIIAGAYREDLCLRAGEIIEAGAPPIRPVDPS